MQAIQQGDRSAVEELVRHHHRPMIAYFYRLSGDYHLAQDLAQECLFRVVSRAGQYRYPEPLKPWLFRIAVNIWRDQAKSAAYRRGQAAVPLDHADPDHLLDPPPDEAVADRLLAREALATLRSLPAPFSEVLVLRFCQALTVPEIAAALELPDGTVKTRIFQGLRRLRAQLTLEVKSHG